MLQMRPCWPCQARIGATYFQMTSVLSKKRKNDTKAAKHHQQALAMLVPKYEHFPDVKTWSTAGEPVTWQGNNYPPSMLPTEHVVQGILWEPSQLNFAYEFLSLDHHTCLTLDHTSDNLQLIQDLVSKIFLVNPFLSRSLPYCNSGLATNDIEERIPYVVCFVQVMQSWKGNKPPHSLILSGNSPKSGKWAWGGHNKILLPAVLQLLWTSSLTSSSSLYANHMFSWPHVILPAANLFLLLEYIYTDQWLPIWLGIIIWYVYTKISISLSIY